MCRATCQAQLNRQCLHRCRPIDYVRVKGGQIPIGMAGGALGSSKHLRSNLKTANVTAPAPPAMPNAHSGRLSLTLDSVQNH